MQTGFDEKLKILNCPFRDNLQIDVKNVNFRKTLLWLEDQKLRSGPLPETFKKIDSDQWQDGYSEYKKLVNCPVFGNSVFQEFYWILSKAIQSEYAKNKKKYENVTKHVESSKPKIVSENPLDKLDFESDEFKNGVQSLAKLLKVHAHSDHLLTLKACSEFIAQKLNPQELQKIGKFVKKNDYKKNTFAIDEIEIGFDLGKPNLNRAAKCLCLLYIHNLRDLQTEINEIIVLIQNITADPKTDSKLGRVGGR